VNEHTTQAQIESAFPPEAGQTQRTCSYACTHTTHKGACMYTCTLQKHTCPVAVSKPRTSASTERVDALRSRGPGGLLLLLDTKSLQSTDPVPDLRQYVTV